MAGGFEYGLLRNCRNGKKWNISSRRIDTFCIEGRIEGAIRKGKKWLIPADAEKTRDARCKKVQPNIK